MSLNVDNLRFGTQRHAKLLSALQARYKLSEERMESTRVKCDEAEEIFNAYVPTPTADEVCSNTTAEEDYEDYTEVYIPMSYAQMLSFHTYAVSTLLARDPVLQFQGRHGEPEDRVQAVEAVMDYQMRVGRCLAPMYIWLHDAPKYGGAILGNYWENEVIAVSRVVEQPKTWLGMPIAGSERKVTERVEVAGYQGNRSFNIRPRDWLPDPRVPQVDLQRGEFAGYMIDITSNELHSGELDGQYFNTAYVKKRGPSSSTHLGEDNVGVREQDDTRVEASSLETPAGSDVGTYKAYVLYVRLVPKHWELDEAQRPEIWRFTVVEKEVVIEARPLGAYHDKFPFFPLPFEIEGYKTWTRSMLEILKPLNDTMTWLFNSHFFNVRSALNNSFIYNPSLVVHKDVVRRGTAKNIRMKPEAMGIDPHMALRQLNVVDVTQGHLRDSQIVGEMMQRVSGVTDNLMGMVNAGGRKTATEVRSSNTFGINRLKTQMEYWSETGLKDLAQIMLQQTQQWMTEDRQFRLAGDLIPEGKEFRRLGPEDIAGFYDYVPVDGTLPIDRYAQANLWKEILMGLVKMPQIAMGYNMPGIFEWMAQIAGLKNIKRFRVQVMPDQDIMGAAAQGNVVPMGRVASEANLAERGLGSPGEPGQIPGMGQTS